MLMIVRDNEHESLTNDLYSSLTSKALAGFIIRISRHIALMRHAIDSIYLFFFIKIDFLE